MQRLEKNLQRLTFKVSAAPTDDSQGLVREPWDLSFIYGIGTDGLSDFEMAIDGLGLREVFNLEIDQSKMKSYFGWLYHAVANRINLSAGEGSVNLKFLLQVISTPEPKEIVAAIAALQNHGGCGSGCDCGCH